MLTHASIELFSQKGASWMRRIYIDRDVSTHCRYVVTIDRDVSTHCRYVVTIDRDVSTHCRYVVTI